MLMTEETERLNGDLEVYITMCVLVGKISTYFLPGIEAVGNLSNGNTGKNIKKISSGG